MGGDQRDLSVSPAGFFTFTFGYDDASRLTLVATAPLYVAVLDRFRELMALLELIECD